MTSKYLGLFDPIERDKAQLNVDYYDGRGDKFVKTFIDTRRVEAVKNGMTPFTRNLTRQIVDKSGMMFNGRPPEIEVYDEDGDKGLNDLASARALDAFEKAGWIEFFTNFDPLLRLNKTGLVHVQADLEAKAFVFNAITQANGAAHFKKKELLDTVVYLQGKTQDGTADVYAVETEKQWLDLIVSNAGIATEQNTMDNPFGFVTAASFHDTNVPMRGNWNPIPTDLSSLNFKYNLHLTDTDYIISWMKYQTLYTNANVESGTIPGGPNEHLSKFAARNAESSTLGGMVGGPSRVIGFDSDGDTPYFEYKGPKPDLAVLEKIIKDWFRDFASDWSVRVESEQAGLGADSGFKLQILEIPNMELRKKRQRMMEAGFKRLYKIMLAMDAKLGGVMGLIQGTELFIKFPVPELPVDEKATEEVWSRKIKEGRASLVEYFIVQGGLDRKDAEAKVKQLALDRKTEADANTVAGAPAPSPAPAPQTTNVVI